jgi:hypothetical protein
LRRHLGGSYLDLLRFFLRVCTRNNSVFHVGLDT